MPSSYLSSATSTFSNLLTNTTSKYTTLRRQLLSTDERDGDTEDDTHVCRVLRAYYTEKSRPFPGWLPPDPRRPNSGGGATASAGYGGSLRPELGAPRPTSGGRGLSDLFGPASAAPVSSMRQGSLRRSEGSTLRVPGGDGGQRGTSPQPSQGQMYGNTGAGDMGRRASPVPAANTGSNFLSPASAAGSTGARPLPSQRDGSYQSLRLGRQVTPVTPGYGDEYGGGEQLAQPQAPVGNSAQDRLKAKLCGRR